MQESIGCAERSSSSDDFVRNKVNLKKQSLSIMPKSSHASAVERKLFTQRLQYCLEKMNIELSPTKLASAFNLHSPCETVTTHGARKWLVGEAIPTQAKLIILAKWLRVDPSWLRFGDAELPGAGRSADIRDNSMESDIKLLDEDERELVRALLGIIFRSRGRNPVSEVRRGGG